MKVALVCSWLNQYGGAERVLEALHDMFPEAPIYTSIHWPEAMPSAYRTWDIRTSFLDRLPLIKQRHQPFLPLYPLAFEEFDLSEYDLIISNSSAFAHGIITPPHTLHICYCLTPARFLWSYHQYIVGEELGPLTRALLPPFIYLLRLWDRAAADRVDRFVTISEAVRQRIAKYYRREAKVIPPPVDTESYLPAEAAEDYFLLVSRLVPYKRIDLAVRAFNELDLPLVIIGDGRDRMRLQAMAHPNIRFLGRLPDGEVRQHFARCRAFIFPGEEDFGISSVEAQAAGRPVIAFAGGGALETVEEGVSGLFFHQPTAASLAGAVRALDHRQYDPTTIRQRAQTFSIENFKARMRSFIEEATVGKE